MNSKNFNSVRHQAWKIDKEYLVESPFADHFSGQKIDAVRGSGDEKAARHFLLHPGEKKRKYSALLPAGIVGGRDPHFDLVEPLKEPRAPCLPSSCRPRRTPLPVYHAVRRRSRSCPPDTAGAENSWRDGLHRQALAATRDAHNQDTLGHDFRAQAIAQLEQLAALQQPFLQAFQPSDVSEILGLGNELDDAAFGFTRSRFSSSKAGSDSGPSRWPPAAARRNA